MYKRSPEEESQIENIRAEMLAISRGKLNAPAAAVAESRAEAAVFDINPEGVEIARMLQEESFVVASAINNVSRLAVDAPTPPYSEATVVETIVAEEQTLLPEAVNPQRLAAARAFEADAIRFDLRGGTIADFSQPAAAPSPKI